MLSTLSLKKKWHWCKVVVDLPASQRYRCKMTPITRYGAIPKSSFSKANKQRSQNQNPFNF
ncbi:hypothetical protein Ciccas_003217 [Cichlidogyrus casuarinus]|uniref:Uncharacterized protein n=1 Tax=Cichlidogyrus casuarinus TaxID=1844966 RepID=A0ABD2QF08_9PLAT